jgi:hypothetical protein
MALFRADHFLKAQEMDPASATINNNLDMLRDGARAKRS